MFERQEKAVKLWMTEVLRAQTISELNRIEVFLQKKGPLNCLEAAQLISQARRIVETQPPYGDEI